jgi:large subunit ribosomal protein L22
MSKPKRERSLAANEAKAVLRNLRTSPIKLNLVAEMIRGMKAADALTQLQFSNKRIAVDVRKVLQSAIANAENNHNLNVDSLVVKEAWVGKGMVMKRFHARARGRGAAILKPHSHLTIVVREAEGA